MQYKRLGKTGLMVSEIGFGGEWLERHDESESVELVKYAGERGVNIIDCWMPDPKSRSIIGKAIAGCRDKWYVQGHIGSTWQNGQYVRSRDLKYVIPAFEDQLERIGGGYIDLGMIHYVDSLDEWHSIMDGSDYLDYVFRLKKDGIIRHIGISTHNPRVARLAARTDFIEMMLFSINPAFDMRPPTEDLDELFKDYETAGSGIDPERAELYALCEQNDVGITVMKGFFGGRLFKAETSPFGTAFTPVQCIHYSLTRPAVASILCGFDTRDQLEEALLYETATEDEKDYASIIASAPLHSYSGQCTYCGHCKPCPAEIDIAIVNKFYDLAVSQDEVPESVRSHYSLLSHKASECIGCRGCESRCPFGVEVSERMKKTAELFGI